MTHTSESGNAFILILAGVVMFTALAMTMSRSSNTQSTGLLSRKQSELAATEIMDYAQALSRGVNRLRGRGCSENDLSFESVPYDGDGDYTNSDAPDDFSCHVFHPQGGVVQHKSFPINWTNIDGPDLTWEPIISGTTCIPGVGNGDDASCLGNTNSRDSELLFIAPDINDDICTEINNALGTYNGEVKIIPNLDKFTGSFDDKKEGGTNTSDLEGNFTAINSACWNSAGENYYYKVILAR